MKAPYPLLAFADRLAGTLRLLRERIRDAVATEVGLVAGQAMQTVLHSLLRGPEPRMVHEELYRDDYVDASPDASRKKRYKEAVSRAEMLYGQLDQKQLERVGVAIDKSSFNARASYEERLRRQGDMLQTMRAVATEAATRGLVGEKAQQAIAAMFARSFNSPNAAYQTYLEQLTQGGCKSFAELHNSTTAAQRAKAVEIIGGYEQQLSLLASNRQKG